MGPPILFMPEPSQYCSPESTVVAPVRYQSGSMASTLKGGMPAK